ncbi:MAG: hypothetical protein HON94_10700 [Methylococcales bacterium]|jgi:Ca2+/H+ antiporter, TMEM165/GDT1 family|nr:hypothetical protein [Methylococcales bacterium]MBT7411282.1 hypothetical protein [Methylococcales bacterium]
MDREKAIFSFFIMLAFALNVGFFLGDIDNISHHSSFAMFAAITVNLIATVLKIGDRSQLGTFMLSSCLVADIQLIFAAGYWAFASHVFDLQHTEYIVDIVKLSGGAAIATFISIIILLIDTASMRR